MKKPKIEPDTGSQPLSVYSVAADDVNAEVKVIKDRKQYVPQYIISFPSVRPATEAVLRSVHDEIVRDVNITPTDLLNPKVIGSIKDRFKDAARKGIDRMLPGIDEMTKRYLIGTLVHDMFGLGRIELLLQDENLEEIVVNSSEEPLWVYHKSFGWLKTNVKMEDEDQIHNYSSMIGRRVGRQINNLFPLMDAHLFSGDRVNSTLFPISTKGNTITIRKFARNPWTIVDFIDPKIGTVSKEVAALLWMGMQYELNMIVGGGTASGKTSFLNTLAPFIQPNQRIISIEDTRELQLPDFAHWIPLNTREANPEGKGEVSMLDLMVNSLRMRPDRILVGEIRKHDQAEVMLEAMHTGHSVYSTMHANSVEEMYHRLVNPPIDIPESQLDVLNLAIIQFRHRRLGIRRTLQVAELSPQVHSGERRMKMNVLYQWNPQSDKIERVGESQRIFRDITDFTGMTEKEIRNDLDEKEKILEWMMSSNIKTVNTVGKIIGDYYVDKNQILDLVKKKARPEEVFSQDLIMDLKAHGHMK